MAIEREHKDWMDWMRAFAAGRRWQFARTMPRMPHEHTVREWHEDEAAFEQAVRLIRDTGYQRAFGKRTFTYLDLDGWKYWTMGAPIPETTVLNRAKLKPPSPAKNEPDLFTVPNPLGPPAAPGGDAGSAGPDR